ncbi:MAG: TonB-dependent receptor plug domain-containing protein, partial [Candidatus Kapaibacterium sp.]
DTIIADSTARLDSLRTRLPVRELGAPLGSVTELFAVPGTDFIIKRDLVWERYTTPHDFIARLLPAYPLSQGVPGLLRTLSYGTSGPGAISYLYDGRPLLGLFGAAYESEFYPAEFLERVEVVRGARAAIVGSGESLIALNFVQPRYDVEGSYTRLWYAQAPGSSTAGDITYDRNVGRKGNLALGFRRSSSNGVYTLGSGTYAQNDQRVSSWNARGSLRWDFSDALAVSITEIFSDVTRGASGGLTPESSTVEVFAQTVNDSLQERMLRHDLSLTARWYPAMSGYVHTPEDSLYRHADTSYRIDGSLYYSHVERDLLVGDRPAIIPFSSQPKTDAHLGGRLAVSLTTPLVKLLGNANAELVNEGIESYLDSFRLGDDGSTKKLRYDLGALAELAPARAVAVRLGAKLFNDRLAPYLVEVAEGVLNVTDSISLRLTVRNTSRLKAATDAGASNPDTVTIRYLADDPRGQLAEAALGWRDGVTLIELGGYIHRISAPDGSGLPSTTVAGADARIIIPYGVFRLDNHLIGTFGDRTTTPHPVLYGESELYAQLRLLGGNLDLRLGTSLEYQSSASRVRYDVLSNRFYMNTADATVPGMPFPLWGAYLQARIGSAYLRLEMRNILDVPFYTIDRYPTFGRGVFLGANWALVD